LRRALLITGANGLIGRYLQPALALSEYERVYCFTRAPLPYRPEDVGEQRCVEIRGDLTDPDTYTDVLTECDTVVHMAAATGKQPPSRYHEVNVIGTRELISRCEQANVTNFLHVSTIAAKSIYDRRYRYAESKRLAEELVQASNLRYTIIRPTIVLAKESPIWLALSRLARLPRPVVFGSGSARIQPIYILDLVECINDILKTSLFNREIYDLGGPDVLSFREFVEAVHQLYSKKFNNVLTIPITPLISSVSLLENMIGSRLPITAGQLIAFMSDGTIEENVIFRRHAGRMHSIQSVLRMLTTNGNEAHAA
jgi:nucleoside-diphosphate-sugar epimerase